MKKIIFFTLSFYSIFIQSQYYNNSKDGLIIRNRPSLQGDKIGKFNYLDYIKIEKKLPNKKLTINNNGNKISGYWVKVNFKNKPAYVFSSFLKTKSKLRKYKTIIDYSSIKINGKLLFKCKEDDYIRTLGKPDSIIVNRVREKLQADNYTNSLKTKYKGLFKYKDFEYWDDVECEHFQGNCHNTKTFYKNGIGYEEFDGKMILKSILFENKSNYLIYKNQKWDYKTNLDDIIKKFPIINIFEIENSNLKTISPHDHFFSEIKWYMIFNEKNKLLEFGL